MAVDVMTPTLAGVGVVLFLLLVICTMVLLIVMKRRSGRNSKEDAKKQTIGLETILAFVPKGR